MPLLFTEMKCPTKEKELIFCEKLDNLWLNTR